MFKVLFSAILGFLKPISQLNAQPKLSLDEFDISLVGYHSNFEHPKTKAIHILRFLIPENWIEMEPSTSNFLLASSEDPESIIFFFGTVISKEDNNITSIQSEFEKDMYNNGCRKVANFSTTKTFDNRDFSIVKEKNEQIFYIFIPLEQTLNTGYLFTFDASKMNQNEEENLSILARIIRTLKISPEKEDKKDKKDYFKKLLEQEKELKAKNNDITFLS